MQLLRRYGGTIQQTRLKKLDRSTSCREATEGSRTCSIDPPSYREAIERLGACSIERCRDYDKKQLKSSTDRLGVEELSRLHKNSFSRRENTDMNAIKHAIQPIIQSTF